MPRELWYPISIPGDYRELSNEYGVSPAMARLLVNRIADRNARGPLPSAADAAEYLSPDASVIYTYEKLPDIEKCTDILQSVISSGKKIRVIGDYDIDGVCSTYILSNGLHKAGANADYAIPHRITDGYGLNERLIREAAAAGTDCVITCDNGISASAQIDLAHELGMTIIVTDHHEVPYHMLGDTKVEDIPDADAVVDIKRSDSKYGFTEICGAVVAFKVIAALFDRLGIERGALEDYVELAAFATIGDVMPLVKENRALVKEGLRRLKDTTNPGLRALIRAQGIEGSDIMPYHVGFILGPCINATGRLASADNALELLYAEDEREAERLAGMLVAMNNDRREMTDKGVEKAMELAGSDLMKDDRVLVIYLPDMHESVAGIIAGKVRERSGKPTFVLTDGANEIKGSGRSIDDFDMHELMTKASDLFSKYGGHKMAGGISLKDGVTPEELRERFNSICGLTDDDLVSKIRFDMALPFSYADMRLAEDISGLEPFGVGNPRPLFAAKGVVCQNISILGKGRNVLKCRATDEGGTTLNAVYFGEAERFSEFIKSSESIKILYYPEINEYRDTRSLQIIIQSYC